MCYWNDVFACGPPLLRDLKYLLVGFALKAPLRACLSASRTRLIGPLPSQFQISQTSERGLGNPSWCGLVALDRCKLLVATSPGLEKLKVSLLQLGFVCAGLALCTWVLPASAKSCCSCCSCDTGNSAGSKVCKTVQNIQPGLHGASAPANACCVWPCWLLIPCSSTLQAGKAEAHRGQDSGSSEVSRSADQYSLDAIDQGLAQPAIRVAGKCEDINQTGWLKLDGCLITFDGTRTELSDPRTSICKRQ